MPLDFPNTPGVGSQYSLGGKTWTYNGAAWDLTTPRVGYTGSAGTGGGSASGYSVNIGNGTDTVYTVTHNLNTTSFSVTVTEVSTGYVVYPDVQYLNSNSIDIEFVIPPTTNQYKVSILGYST